MMEVSMKCWIIWTALCITVILKTSASAGGESLERAEAMSAEHIFNYNFSFEIINRIYNNSLQDPQSEDYKNMYKEVSSAFYSVYSCSSCPTFVGYQGVRAMSFRKGSVIANSIIVFKGSLNNPTLIKSVFQNALENNKLINGLQINTESLKDSYAKITTPSPTTTTTTTTTTAPITTTTKTTTTATTTTPSTTPTTTQTTTPSTTPTTTPTTTTTTIPTTTPTNTPTTTPTTTLTTTKTTTKTTTLTTTPTTTLTTKETTTPTTTPTTTKTTKETTSPTTTKTTTETTTSTTTPTTTKTTKETTSPTTTKTTTETTTPTTTLTTGKMSTTQKTSTTPETISKHSSAPPILPTTKPPRPNVSTTITTHSSNTTIHRSVSGDVTNTNFSTTTTPTSDHGEGVPGWAIALLVLAAIAILLLLIIIIILLVRWCCVDNDDDIRSLPPQEHTPYMRTTFREPLSVPAYSPHTPQKNLYPFEDLPQSPKPKRTGTYVVTPER